MYVEKMKYALDNDIIHEVLKTVIVVIVAVVEILGTNGEMMLYERGGEKKLLLSDERLREGPCCGHLPRA